MTEDWVRTELAALATTPAPPAPSYGGLITQGRRQRRRRRSKMLGIGAAVAMVAAGVPVAVLQHADGTTAPSSLAAGQPPAAQVGASADISASADGETSPYWFEQDENTFFKKDSAGVTKVDDHQLNDYWLGNNRSSVISSGNGPTYPQPTDEPAFGKHGFPSFTSHSWTAQWTTKTDAASLRAYLAADSPFTPQHESAVYADEDLFSEGVAAMEFPGPARFRSALVALMKGLPEVTATQGRDDAGRPASVLRFNEGATGASSFAYVDVTSSTLLETVEQMNTGGTLSHVVSPDEPRMQDIWRSTGPVTTAPAATTQAQQEAAAKKAVPQGLMARSKPGNPCTPGVAADIHKVRDRLASMCLDNTIARFTARRNDDSAAVDGASFYLSDGPLPKPVKQSGGAYLQGTNGASLTLQILPGLKSFILSGGSHSLVPTAAGKVGTTTFVARTQVLGVTADEITETDGGIGILADIDGMSLECYASDSDHAAPPTYAQLVTVINHLHWDRLGS